MSGFKSLSTRLVIAMLIPLSLLLLAATWLETSQASKKLIQTGETAATNLAATVKEELQGVLRSTKIGIQALAIGMERLPAVDESQVEEMLRETVEQFPLLYGTTLAFETTSPTEAGLAPYVYRAQGQVQVKSLANNDYRYQDQPWFTAPMETGEGLWTAPYLDDGGGNTRMVTYALPVTIQDRRAVLTADLALEFLSEIAESSLLGRPGAVIVFDRNGRIIAHPRSDWMLDMSLAKIANDRNLTALNAVQSAIANGEELWLRPDTGMHAGLISGENDRPGRLLVMPLKEAGWGIGVYFSDDVFLQDIKDATRFRLIFSLALLILLASVLALVSLRSLRPLGELANRTRAIARGEFHGKTPGQNRRDEIGQLSRAFHRMQDQLQHYIEDLTQATAAQERIDAELTTARLLQHALLPREQPDADELGVDLAALLHSAREVGGDLFNYMNSGDDRLFFVVGDVSDKGVPAALFMTRSNALIKAAAARGGGPEAVIASVNQALCDENELCMFVTLLAGELDLKTGELQLASAGHEVPLLMRTDGQVEELNVETGPPLGIDEDAQFPVFQCTLGENELLVTYTDGVTEARAPDGKLFGTQRLEEILGSAPRNSSASVLDAINQAVEHFAAGEDQSDDITLLIVRRLPGAPGQASGSEPSDVVVEGRMQFEAERGCHTLALPEIEKALTSVGSKACEPADVRLILEELLTNIVKYGHTEEHESDVIVAWRITPEQMDLRIEDHGIAFNPLEEDEENLSDEERCEGGMGIMLVRAMAHSIRYSRLEGRNCLELTFVV